MSTYLTRIGPSFCDMSNHTTAPLSLGCKLGLTVSVVCDSPDAHVASGNEPSSPVLRSRFCPYAFSPAPCFLDDRKDLLHLNHDLSDKSRFVPVLNWSPRHDSVWESGSVALHQRTSRKSHVSNSECFQYRIKDLCPAELIFFIAYFAQQCGLSVKSTRWRRVTNFSSRSL